MATSNSADFSVTRNEIIQYALQQIGVVGEGETPTSSQYTEGAFLLNMIVKARQSDGMPLWDMREGYILPFTGSPSVSLGGTAATVSAYVVTTTSAASTSGTSTITLTLATGFVSGQPIGVEQSDGTMLWTTATIAGSVATLATPLTADVDSSAYVYTYATTARIFRPLRVISAYIINNPNTSRYPTNIITKDQYLSLGGPWNASVPNQIYYDPQLGQGTLYVYPQFQGGDNVLEITYQKPYEDFDAAGDTPDFPQEWYMAIVTELAAVMGGKYGVPISERKMLLAEAEQYRMLALSNGTEEGSMNIQPDWRYYDIRGH